MILKSALFLVFFLVYQAEGAASEESTAIVDALEANLTTAQTTAYLEALATIHPAVADAIIRLPDVSLSQLLCTVNNLSDIISLFIKYSNSPTSIPALINSDCNSDSTTNALGLILVEFEDTTTMDQVIHKFANLFRDVPFLLRVFLEYVLIGVADVQYRNNSVSETDLSTVQSSIRSFNNDSHSIEAIVALIPSTAEIFNEDGTYNAAYNAFIDGLPYLLQVEDVTADDATALNQAIASLYEYLHANLLDYIGFVFNWLVSKHPITETVSGNSSLASSISSLAGEVSEFLPLGANTIANKLDAFFNDPYTVNASSTV